MMEMTEKERVTVDLDAECYYLDGEFWESWDNYGEEMADEINKLLNEQDERIKELEKENEKLKKELFESEKDYIMETYSDNPIRRDEKIQSLKEEFKARFGDVE